MARIISAVVFLPILIVTLWRVGPIYFASLVMIAVVLGLVEYYGITDRVNARTSRVPGTIAAVGVLIAFYQGRHDWIVPILASLLIIEMSIQLFINARQAEPDLRNALSSAAAPVFGVIYVAVLGGYMIALRVVPDDGIQQLAAKLLSLFFLIVFAGDTGAYYAGRNLGKRKLAPRISPGKTVEGSIGGLVANVLAVVIAHFTFFPELPLASAIPLALVMGVLGQIGDLCESMLKRGAQIKDAAHIIPGHGGLLDRLDSIVFNAPVLYYYYVFFLK
ncbi:MAG TPA: phosphatidate cytidylyltransferase [Blastocatellia bacterium]|nr:phosphatidate cytidylyltransferase [Blastocatellia bacterium]